MYLSRLILNPRSSAVRAALGDCQIMHRTLMGAFPKIEAAAARQAVGLLYRVEPVAAGPPLVIAQSSDMPSWDALGADYLRPGPDGAAVAPLAPFMSTLAAGQAVRFRLTANPTRKIDTKSGPDGQRRNGRRVDVRSTDDRLTWLRRKFEATGLEALALRDGGAPDVVVTPLPLQKGRRPGGSTMTFASVLFEGHAQIVDADAVRRGLASGIGTAKAYGFGLLSLAAADAS